MRLVSSCCGASIVDTDAVRCSKCHYWCTEIKETDFVAPSPLTCESVVSKSILVLVVALRLCYEVLLPAYLTWWLFNMLH